VAFSIAQVTPWPWEQHHEVNRFVERLSDELCRRGHDVVVVAPSDSRELVREGRAIVRRMRDDPLALFEVPGCATLLAVGQSLPFRRGGSVSLPLDVSRTLEELLELAELDFVHVHEPFAPSASSAALRHSRALNIGTFHSTTERFVSTQFARPLVELLFGRLDGRTASFAASRELMERYFPGDYHVILPGADLVRMPATDDGGPARIVFSAEEERGALRLFLRALRRLPLEAEWEAQIWMRDPGAAPAVSLPRRLRDRVSLVGPADGSEAQHLARARIAVAASNGAAPAPQLVLRALAGGAVPVVARLPQYEQALREWELGLLFEPRDTYTLAAQLGRLLTDHDLLTGFERRIADAHPQLGWERVADEFEQLYEQIASRRHPADGRPGIRKRLRKREFIHVDLHMHTDHSPDCATPVDTLLKTAKGVGLGAIAITDHNEISGALEARDRADGIKVIVAEEVKTADQGEVIGLFIERKIERGLTLRETIAEIRRQGGLVYVPHPFDRMHSVPDYEHLLDVVEDLDAMEVFNPRVAFSAFNEEAARFAAKYRIVAGAGSDSHVAQGLGSVKIKMRDFDGPEEFLESLRDADIVRKRQSLLYVQALKFLQTKTRSSTRSASTGPRSKSTGTRSKSTGTRSPSTGTRSKSTGKR
jgi:predicted metal-dependent phosphoesterase TrpH/glycosyltransferase involved in cell wall biosynthesis